MQLERIPPLTGIIAVVRTQSSATAMTAARALAGTRVDSIEITMTVPDAVEVIRALATEASMTVGAGTVIDASSVSALVQAGAGFIVSPGFDRRVVDAARSENVPVVPGALTPTEIMTAWDAGASAVKVFPIGSVGGASYLRAVAGPLPHIPIVVSGGVTAVEIDDYFAAGAAAVSLGSSLFDAAAVRTGDVAAVRRRVNHVLGEPD